MIIRSIWQSKCYVLTTVNFLLDLQLISYDAMQQRNTNLIFCDLNNVFDTGAISDAVPPPMLIMLKSHLSNRYVCCLWFTFLIFSTELLMTVSSNILSKGNLPFSFPLYRLSLKEPPLM